MRIGVITHNYPPHIGGLEVIVRELTKGYAKRHDVVVVSTAWDGQSGVSREDGATVHRLPAWHGAEELGVPYAMPLGPGVRAAITALRTCDVLHAHGSLYATTILGLLARRRGVPLFTTEHVGFVPYSSAALNLVQRLAWKMIGEPVTRRSTRVIAYNSRVRDWVAGRVGMDNVAFIVNGVDNLTFRPRDLADRHAARVRLKLPQEPVLGLFVGRDAQKKNLEAVLNFPANSYQLMVCGARRTLPPRVLNLGTVPHDVMPDVFAAADFLLHAATGEGFPVTVQEAMASGLPVILLWDEGYEGSVDGDAVIAVESLEQMAGTAEQLATSAEQRNEWRRRSRAFAERNWSWDAAVERHLALFRSALA